MISIICSNYNSTKWIDGYLESLNAQYPVYSDCGPIYDDCGPIYGDYGPEGFEVIFVDANSTDDSLDKIKNFEYNTAINVKIIENKSRIGIYDAWNQGIENSSHEFVMNYNTDDRLLPNAIATYSAIIEKRKRDYHLKNNPQVGDIFYSSYIIVDNAQYAINSNTTIFRPTAHSHQRLLRDCYPGPFPLVRKSVIEKLGGYKQKFDISGDYEMWLNMSYNDYTFVPMSSVIGYYFTNPEGNSTKQSDDRFKRHIAQDRELRTIYNK